MASVVAVLVEGAWCELRPPLASLELAVASSVRAAIHPALGVVHVVPRSFPMRLASDPRPDFLIGLPADARELPRIMGLTKERDRA